MKTKISITITLLLFSISNFCLAQRSPKSDPKKEPVGSRSLGKPSGNQGLLRPKPRELITAQKEIEKALKNGEINRQEAGQKLRALNEKFRENIKEKRHQKPELPQGVKADLDAIKGKKDALRAELRETLEKLGKDATQEERKQAVEKFKEANKDRHQAIKEEYETIREQIKESRPSRPVRPEIELSDELKADLEAIKAKREELHEAQKALHEKLKNASAEDRQAMITAFKESNKETHILIKEKSKALKKAVRETIEIDDTRTSDL
jgi:hypothetical protein